MPKIDESDSCQTIVWNLMYFVKNTLSCVSKMLYGRRAHSECEQLDLIGCNLKYYGKFSIYIYGSRSFVLKLNFWTLLLLFSSVQLT